MYEFVPKPRQILPPPQAHSNPSSPRLTGYTGAHPCLHSIPVSLPPIPAHINNSER
ncbi:unnamed protein product [Lepidochelys kempii]